MANTQELNHKDAQYVWHPFTQIGIYAENDNIIIEKGHGSYLYNAEGDKYLDGCASLWVSVHGHQHKKLNEAIHKRPDKVAHSTLLGSSDIPPIKLAGQLVKLTSDRLRKVFYSDTGSVSVETVTRMVYQYWKNIDTERYAKENKSLTLHHGYYGDTIGSVSVGGVDSFYKIFKDLISESMQVGAPCLYKSKYRNEAEMLNSVLNQIESVLSERDDEMVGFILEPLVQGATGLLVHPHGFLKAVEQLCRKYNTLLICDEVAVGFGRAGEMPACSHEDVQPDIMCLDKAIIGGYLPLAATLASQKICDYPLYTPPSPRDSWNTLS